MMRTERDVWPPRPLAQRVTTLLGLLLALTACGAGGPATAPIDAPDAAESTSAPASAGIADQAEQRAVILRREAEAIEPGVTKTLKQVAEQVGAAFVKLEFRLKTVRSAARKIRKHQLEDPELHVDSAKLDDMLRYTMRLEDEPPGHYVEAGREVLRAVEAQGHRVERLKNYWPQDDNYSGVNCVLRAPGGMKWELQFHTAASLAAAATTRAWYEEMRRVDTPLARKRELFDEMTRAWNEVEVPKSALSPKAIHERAQILKRPRP